MSLHDRPDPRRLDLRASLRTFTEDWLVRVNRQRAGIAVRALVDVSASMSFGGRRPKLHVVADFVESLGLSAFRVGDAVGMLAFDDGDRADLLVPARVGRGVGDIMAGSLRTLVATPAERPTATRATRQSSPSDARVTAHCDGLETVAAHLAGQQGLVFLVSDFHWPLERLDAALDLLAHADVIPVVVWDSAEIEPPGRDGLVSLRDAESGARRTLWIRPRLRDEWRAGVACRRAEIARYFAARGLRPFYLEGAFNADALSRYFFEVAA